MTYRSRWSSSGTLVGGIELVLQQVRVLVVYNRLVVDPGRRRRHHRVETAVGDDVDRVDANDGYETDCVDPADGDDAHRIQTAERHDPHSVPPDQRGDTDGVVTAHSSETDCVEAASGHVAKRMSVRRGPVRHLRSFNLAQRRAVQPDQGTVAAER